ncbi:MAG: glycoside hydrolase family 16 protein [Flavobacteriaceae bacterium]|nr:glycoside hydrolase family 16 protein [Flavobacteriaceae bacterium]
MLLIKSIKFSSAFLLRYYVLIFISAVYAYDSSSKENDNTIIFPSNLVVNTSIVGSSATNPYGDGSGVINFNISAKNAMSYTVLLGNRETKNTVNGNFTYTYKTSGTNTYNLYVSAYNGNQFISTSLAITIFVTPILLWSDEFDTNGFPNSTKWGYAIGTGANGWGNNESQYYTNRPENVFVQDGVLKIIAKKDAFSGSDYTSARILTKGKFSFKYGKVEIKAKLPSGGGTWPALWMLGDTIDTVGWPACGEIDIMEHIGNNQGTAQSAMHTPSSYGNTINKGSQFILDVSESFHIYSLEWTSEKMVFSVDGTVHYTYNPSTKNSETWPFNANQFIIMNLAMGGNLGGTIDPNFISSTLEVDYIRVYQ